MEINDDQAVLGSPRQQKIRTAVVGFGLAGRAFHSPLISSNSDYELSVIATGNHERALVAAETYPEAKIVPDFNAVLDQASKLDLVVIATPPKMHFSQTKAALEAGLDVVVDKPFTTTSAEGEELVALAARLGRKLSVYQNRRWDNAFLTLQRLLGTGELGQVHRFEANMERFSPGFSKPWKAKDAVESGGGIVFDLGTHLIDCALQLFGPARLIHAQIRALRPGEPADDDAFFILEHEPVGDAHAVTSHLSMSLQTAQSGPVFDVRGTAGSYVKYGIDPQEPQLSGGLLPGEAGYGEEPETAWGVFSDGSVTRPVPTVPGAYQNFYKGMANYLHGVSGPPVDPSGQTGPLAGLRLIEQARSLSR